MSEERGNRRYAVPAEVVIEAMGDTAVAVHMGTDQIHELNETAGRLVELLAAGKSESEAAAALATEFEADVAEVSVDVEQTVDVLLAAELLSPR